MRVLESLRAAGIPVVGITLNPIADDSRLAGIRVIKGDCQRRDLLEQANIRDARGIVIVTSDDLVNISTALLARTLNPHARIVVRMFNQNLISRFGVTVKNTVALSVSALIAPVLALTAISGDTLGAFKVPDGPRQISELAVTDNTEIAGKRIADFAREHNLVPLAHIPATGAPQFLRAMPSDTTLSPGDRLVVCGTPQAVSRVLQRLRGDLLPGVQWAGVLRRWFRTVRRTLGEVDLSVKIITPVLFVTLFASTLIFRYGVGSAWGDGLYQTVSIIATGGDLHGENKPEWVKVFLSVLKLAGAALVAGFTAILTNYLIRARLGGALEVRHVPDSGHVLVCGLGNVGYRLVQELTAMGERVVTIDNKNDNPFLNIVRQKGVPVFIGDATVPELLRQSRADTAKAVIAATSDELANLEIALLVREMNPKQRIVVRLSDPHFAEAVRDAANITHAMSVPALAAPAFASALYGDSVESLVTAAGRTLAVVALVVNDAEDHLNGKSVRALVIDYAMLPIALANRDVSDIRGYRLQVGDRLTVVVELADYERLLRQQRPLENHRVVVTAVPATARESLAARVQTHRNCTPEAAQEIVSRSTFTFRKLLTRGEAEALAEELTAEGITAHAEEYEPQLQ
jgi:Trk K+ transport system NAD-binding subunit